MTVNYSFLGQTVRRHDLTRQLAQLSVGLEVESHRIQQQDGHLSQMAYPVTLGNPITHTWIKNDFGQTQSEVMTPKMASVSDTLNFLAAANDTLRKSLGNEEALWLYSMPPQLSQNRHEFRIAEATPEKMIYMAEVVKRRDIAKSITSGLHINLGLKLDVLHMIYERYFQMMFSHQVSFQNQIYLKIAQGLMHYRWLFTLLFGQSPIADDSFYDQMASRLTQPVRSIRSSHYGFGNQVAGSYQSVSAYVDKITQAVVSGSLIAEREFYDVVRLKGQSTLQNLDSKGVKYLELRLFDLDAMTQTGVNETTIQFTELFFVYLMMTEPVLGVSEIDEQLLASRAKNDAVALENPLMPSQYQGEAIEMLQALAEFAYDNQFKADWLPSLQRQLTTPLESPSARLLVLGQNQFYDQLLKLSNNRQRLSQQGAVLAGFGDLPLETQVALQAQLRRGERIKVDVDEKWPFDFSQ
jgi:glutamate--cysteine ligase